jgi:hypothetical protein
METGLEKLSKMIDEQMTNYDTKHPQHEYMRNYIEEKNILCPFCKNKELKEDSDAFECHLKNH